MAKSERSTVEKLQSRRVAESHSCRVAKWQYGRVAGLGGGGGVAGECRVAEWLSW